MASYVPKRLPYAPPPELRQGDSGLHPVIIVGAGPVGLAAAIDLAQHGVRSILLDDNDTVSVGSRAICWSKRTLEIFDRLGVGRRMVEKGVTWQVGRVYHRDRELYSFNLLPEAGHKMPAFINLQQYYVEQYLVERAQQFPELIDLRWKNKVVAVQPSEDQVAVTVRTPDGDYTLRTRWLVAADGARSAVRDMLGLPFTGHVFEEKFLIADIQVRQADFPCDRRFWFQPRFDPGESVLIHRQPDDIFRIDFQLGWEADGERERQPERVAERVRRVIGAQVDFELDWCSVYTFRCARLQRFVHGRVLFAGDSAHVVSPFGARGGNGGIQDVDNLCWKLARVVQGKSQPALLESYDQERGHGCEENILNSSRTTGFMTPKSVLERQLRDAVLALAAEFPFAHALVNAGRLSRPCCYAQLRSSLPDDDPVAGDMVPGMPCIDAPGADATGADAHNVDVAGVDAPLADVPSADVPSRHTTGAGVAGIDAAGIDEPGSRRWLLERLGGEFSVLTFVSDTAQIERCVTALREHGVDLALWCVLPTGVRSKDCAVSGDIANGACVARALFDEQGLLHQRYGGEPGVTYLIRPDQHVASRWRRFDGARLAQALSHASAAVVGVATTGQRAVAGGA